ncbi:MAG: flagellar hook-basal body complex protein FliE [Pseudomonadota bacterium]
MNDIDVSQLLSQLRTMSAAAKGAVAPAQESGVADFSSLLKNSIKQVSDMQVKAGDLAKAFEAGDKQVDLAEVMVALQKASISFQAMTQVRNKLVSAYQDIMNMQV